MDTNTKKAEFHSLLYGCVKRPQDADSREKVQKLTEMYHETLAEIDSLTEAAKPKTEKKKSDEKSGD